jgi:hypothetical protein
MVLVAGWASVAPAGCASGPPEGSAVGQRLPELTALDLMGEEVVVGVEKGRSLALVVVATWSGTSRQLVTNLAVDGSVDRVVVASGEPQSAVARWAEDLPDGTRVLIDKSGEIRSALELDYVPSLFFVDQSGVIQYRGANLPAVLGGDGTFG